MGYKNSLHEKEYKRKWYLDNRERILRLRKNYRTDNKEYISKYNAKRRTLAGYKEYEKEYNNKYRKSLKWKEYHRKYQIKYRKIKMATDPQFKLRKLIRDRISKIMGKNYKTSSARLNLGCSFKELKLYLEKQFTEGMSWENHGKWHLDHKKPLKLFNLLNKEEFKQACHYSNLQPLWAFNNMSKGFKVL